MKTYSRVSVADIYEYWSRAGEGAAPLPWHQPPQVGSDQLSSLLVLTARYRVYDLPTYRDFYKIMILNNQVNLVFPDGQSEVILEAYTPMTLKDDRFYTVKAALGLVDKKLFDDSNVIEFKKPKK